MTTGKILIVDDERFFRDLYRDVLEARGHAVRVAGSGQEALQAVSEERFDLMLTDLVMPSTDGIALVAEVQAIDPELEAVVVTGKDDVRLAVRALKAGCADFLVKPVDRDELLIVAERTLERGQLKREHGRLLTENLQFLKAQALWRQCLDILATLDLERLQDLCLQILSRVTDAQGGALWIADDRGQLSLRAYRGLIDRAALPPKVDPHLSSMGELIRRGEPFQAPAAPPGEAFYVPLRVSGETFGLALLSDRARGGFGEEEFSTARAVADFAATAVKNARRFQAMERVGLRDKDTAAYNLAYFVDYAGKEFYKARRYGRTFVLVVASIDNLEQIRKQIGPNEASRGARALIGALSRIARDADILAKVSDNEYYLLLPETDYFGALMFTRRAFDAARKEDSLKAIEEKLPVLVSLGAAAFPKDGEDFDELLHWCRLRIEEQRGSLLRRLHLGDVQPGAFWELADLLLAERPPIPESSPSARTPPDPAFFEAMRREVLREISRDPKARGLLYLSSRDSAQSAALVSSLENQEGGARVYLLGRRGEQGLPSHPLVTPVFLDGDDRLKDHDFVLYLSEHSAYGLVQRQSTPGRLFQTSDAPLVDALIARLQALYDLQPY
jgi:diguanylate cyclase (GGDEF)-like protein